MSGGGLAQDNGMISSFLVAISHLILLRINIFTILLRFQVAICG